jgi:hypothetical protein
MLDFDVQRFSRKCCQTEEWLQPGDMFYSALIAEGAEVVRKDYAAKSWQGPPEGTIGWWKSQVPDVHANKMNWAPNDVILHYFDQLEGNDAKLDMRYVLALLMIRRRIVRLEDMEQTEQHQVFVLYCPRKEREYRVLVVSPSEERVQEIQNELAELLFAGKTQSRDG